MKRILFFVIVLALFSAALFLEFKRLTIKPWPAKHYANDLEHFRYGSIGAEVNGYPYLIWREIPEIFKEDMEQGYQQFGFQFEEGKDIPIGISVRRYGVKRVGFNCSSCHTGTVTINNQKILLDGAPANELDLQAYIEFLAKTSEDPKLTADAVFDSAERNNRKINPFTRFIYRNFVFPRLSQEVENLKSSLAWMDSKPNHGPGRTDAGNFWRERWGLEPGEDVLVGTVDFPSVWNQQYRQKGNFNWDGNNSSLDERNISAALAGGAQDWLLEKHNISRISDWLETLESPEFPMKTDVSLVARGQKIYEQENCNSCHEPDSYRIGQVTPLNEIGTDPQRAELFSAEMVKHFSKVGKGYSWQFENYTATDGYVSMPLDGVWARSPYLHNGSVPTLEDLLTPENQRPTNFYTGCTSYDFEKVGYDCTKGFYFDTSLTGNGNQGHIYGTNLSTQDRLALIEYLKTK